MTHILREAAKLRKKPYVAVGVTQAKGSKLHVIENADGTTSPGKMTVADVAQIHEYGAPGANIPERSFIRSTVDRNEAKYDAQKIMLRDRIFDANIKMTVEKALGVLGQSVTSDMKNTIRENQAGLNGPTPLKHREGTPLLDTAQLVNSIAYAVVADGNAEASGHEGGGE